MKKKKIITVIVILVILAVLLFPIKVSLSDGGSRGYVSWTGLYQIFLLHEMAPVDQYPHPDDTDADGYFEGLEIRIFGKKIYREIYE